MGPGNYVINPQHIQSCIYICIYICIDLIYICIDIKKYHTLIHILIRVTGQNFCGGGEGKFTILRFLGGGDFQGSKGVGKKLKPKLYLILGTKVQNFAQKRPKTRYKFVLKFAPKLRIF